jgi:ribosomal protein L37AE/L43A
MSGTSYEPRTVRTDPELADVGPEPSDIDPDVCPFCGTITDPSTYWLGSWECHRCHNVYGREVS